MLGCGWSQKVAVAIGRNEGSDVDDPNFSCVMIT